MYDVYTLINGAHIYLVPFAGTQSSTTLVMYPVGSRYESEKMRGVSHFIEHLMFKGTKKRKNTQILTREIDRLGAVYNAFTSKEYTGYYIKADADFIETSLDILSDMLFNSTFNPKEMEREKGPVIEEIHMYDDNPIMNIDNIFEDVLFAGCPLGRDIAGTEKHVIGFKRTDVLNYRDKYYQANNMHIVIAGRIPDNIQTLVHRYFGVGKQNSHVSHVSHPSSFGSNKKDQRIRVVKKETDQVQLMLGFPGLNYQDKRNQTLDLLVTILGGTMSSRLFIQIRERRGLAYHIRGGAENFCDTGYVYVRAGLESKNVNKAIKVIQQELQKMVDTPVTKRELEDAQMNIRGGLALSLEDSSAQANWYAQQALFFDKLYTPEERLKQIDQVTVKDIQRLSKHLFVLSKMRLAIIGNVDKERIVF